MLSLIIYPIIRTLIIFNLQQSIMATPATQKEIFIDFDKELYKDRIRTLINPTIDKFKKILKTYTLFNAFFIVLIFSESIYFFIHLTLLIHTFLIAIHLSLIFATLFCYFTLHIYFQTRKAEKMAALKEEYVENCGQTCGIPEGELDHCLMVAHACCQLASDLHASEYQIFRAPAWCSFLSTSFEKANCFFFWADVHSMKELLLKTCIEEQIKIVRMKPIDLEAHAGLANAYVMLSGLYIDPKTVDGLGDDRWIPRKKYDDSSKQKFRSIAEKAIEEFKILSDYAPNDPWVHAQLAYSYRDLQMPKEEIREYETILHLCPDDKDSLFKLGKLYFEQCENAKGLQIYETLKRSNYKKAESLIHFYGAYSNSNCFK